MHANIWIRKENEVRWNGLKDKSAWLNEMLKAAPPMGKAEKYEPMVEVADSRKEPQKLEQAVEKTYDFCKHGAVRGMCKKGCK